MVGSGRHSAACIIASTLSSVADHTLCCGHTFGDVLQKKTHRSTFEYVHYVFTKKFRLLPVCSGEILTQFLCLYFSKLKAYTNVFLFQQEFQKIKAHMTFIIKIAELNL